MLLSPRGSTTHPLSLLNGARRPTTTHQTYGTIHATHGRTTRTSSHATTTRTTVLFGRTIRTLRRNCTNTPLHADRLNRCCQLTRSCLDHYKTGGPVTSTTPRRGTPHTTESNRDATNEGGRKASNDTSHHDDAGRGADNHDSNNESRGQGRNGDQGDHTQTERGRGRTGHAILLILLTVLTINLLVHNFAVG